MCPSFTCEVMTVYKVALMCLHWYEGSQLAFVWHAGFKKGLRAE